MSVYLGPLTPLSRESRRALRDLEHQRALWKLEKTGVGVLVAYVLAVVAGWVEYLDWIFSPGGWARESGYLGGITTLLVVLTIAAIIAAIAAFSILDDGLRKLHRAKGTYEDALDDAAEKELTA